MAHCRLFSSGIVEEILTMLYAAVDGDATVRAVLARMGEHYALSRAYVVENGPDDAWCAQTFVWQAGDVAAPAACPDPAASLCDAAIQPRLQALFNADGLFHAPDVAVLPDWLRSVLRSRGVGATLWCALLGGGVFRGFIGFDARPGAPRWSGEQADTLFQAARLLALFLLQMRRSGDLPVLEENFHAFQSYRRLADRNTIASFRMNLTTNWCGDGESLQPDILEMQAAGTVDGFFAYAYGHFTSPEDLARYKTVFSRERLLALYAAGTTSPSLEYRYCVEPGREIWVRAVVDMEENPRTHDIEALIYAMDIDDTVNDRLTINRLLDTDYEFIARLDARTGIMTEFGEGGDRADVPPRVVGCHYDEELPQLCRSLIHEDYVEEAILALSRTTIIQKLDEGADAYRRIFPTRDGDDAVSRKMWKCLWLDASHAQILITRTDVTDYVLLETDPLTGLYTRQAFYRHARVHLDDHPDRDYLLVRCDIDRFKAYNDTFGTKAGDRLLADLGRFTAREFQGDCVLGRVEADHFVGLFPADTFDVNQWNARLSHWLDGYSPNFLLTSSIGVYTITDRDLEVSLMADRALLALLTVKKSYAHKVAHYVEDMRRLLMEEQALVDDMAQALQSGQFLVYFQPQVNYDTGQLIGAEALVRWQHPKHGLIPPDKFIPLFEKNGFISRLDSYVWEEACVCMRRWIDRDHKMLPVSVSVNISRLDIYDPLLCERLKALVDKYGLPPAQLKLEITESAYMENPRQLVDVVHKLQSTGFIIEMDDFGSGYSSLNTLKDVPVDILKLDIKFLSGGAGDTRGGSILSSVIRMARWLKLPVIAEGVETRDQAEYLKSLSCFYMQGYYFGRPMPAADFEKLLLRSEVGHTDCYRDTDIRGVAAFWDPSVQTTLLFNSFVGGAAIMEYQNGNAEILRANDKFYAQIQTTREAYLHKQRHVLERFEGDNRDLFRDMLEHALLTGDEEDCEVRTLPLSEDTGPLWIHCRVRLLARNSDCYLFYLATQNITERKTMEEELRVSREELVLAVAHAGTTLCHYDVGTRTLTVSEESARRHGIAVSIPNIPYSTRNVAPEDREVFVAFFEKILRGEKDGEVVVRFQMPDGRQAWDRLRFSTVFGDDGAPLRAIISAQDIAAQKEREMESERLRLLLERTGFGVFDYDMTGDTLHAQFRHRIKGMISLDASHYSSYLFQDASYVHPDSKADLAALLRRESQASPRSGYFEFLADNWGMGYRWCRLNYVTLADASGKTTRLIGQLADIQREKDREALLERLDSTLKTKGARHPADGLVVERIFSSLYSANAMDVAIERILAFLGAQYDLSRVYIFEDSADHLRCSNTFEWCAAGVAPEKDRLQHLSYAEDLGIDSRRMFNVDGMMICRDVAELPQAQRDILIPQGIRALLLCAIMNDGVFTGYIGFDECRRTRAWKDGEVATLRLISHILGAFLSKLRASEQAALSADFMAALDDNSAYMYIIEPETCQIVYCNRRILDYYAGKSPLGQRCHSFFLNKGTPCPDCPARVLRESGDPRVVEIRRPGGMLVTVQASRLHWKGRELILLASTDVTALRVEKPSSKGHIMDNGPESV